MPLFFFDFLSIYLDWSRLNIGVVSLAITIEPRDPAKLDCGSFGSIVRRCMLQHLLMIYPCCELLIIFRKTHNLQRPQILLIRYLL